MMNQQNLTSPAEIKMIDNHSCYEEKDDQFLLKIKSIRNKKVSKTKNYCGSSNINEEQCQKISQYAELHARANRINATTMVSSEKNRDNPEVQFCRCGCQKAAGQSISILTNQQNFTFLGPGVLLFFYFIKALQMLVFLVITTYGFFALISNLLSPSVIDFEVCPNKESGIDKFVCQLNTITTFDKKESLLLQQLQLWLGCFVLIVWTLGLNFIEYLGYRKNQQIDDLLDSASDYSIKIDGLPQQNFNQKQLRDFVLELWQTRQNLTQNNFHELSQKKTVNITPLKLKSIQIIYDMTKCRRIIGAIQQLGVEIYEMIDEENKIQHKNSERYKDRKRQMQNLLNELTLLRQKFKEDEQLRKSLSTSCAIISFDLASQQKQFLDHYQDQEISNNLCNSGQKIAFKGKKISISRAPEPSDFSWENCQKKFSYFRQISIWVITLLLLYGASAIVSYTQSLDVVKTSAAVSASILVQLFNRIIWLSLSFFLTFQYHNTKTNFIKSLMKRSLMAQSVNVVIGPMINNLIDNKPLYGENSVSSASLYYQFIMFFMMFIFYVANPFYYLKLICIHIKKFRNIMIRKMSQSIGEISSIEDIRPVLNFYQGPEFPIAGAYVYMSTALIHTFFYCHLQPILLIIFLANVSGFYLIMKYLLFQRCKIPGITQFDIFKLAILFFKFGALFYSVGSIIFVILQHFNKQTELQVINLVPSSICLIVCIIVNINPGNASETINEFIFKIYQFSKHFKKTEENCSNMKINDLLASVIKRLANLKVVYQRKQCYYQFSSLQKLFNFEKQLQQMSDIENMKKIHDLEKFCESFAERSRMTYKANNKKKQNRLNVAMKDLIMIPVLKKSQKNLVSQQIQTQVEINSVIEIPFFSNIARHT